MCRLRRENSSVPGSCGQPYTPSPTRECPTRPESASRVTFRTQGSTTLCFHQALQGFTNRHRRPCLQVDSYSIHAHEPSWKPALDFQFVHTTTLTALLPIPRCRTDLVGLSACHSASHIFFMFALFTKAGPFCKSHGDPVSSLFTRTSNTSTVLSLYG